MVEMRCHKPYFLKSLNLVFWASSGDLQEGSGDLQEVKSDFKEALDDISISKMASKYVNLLS